MSERSQVLPYQTSALTPVAPAEVFASLRASLKDGEEVIERGVGYVIVGRRRPIPWLREVLVAAGVIVEMVVLGLTAVTPLFVVLIPLPLIFAIPFLMDRRERIAVAAAAEGPGTTVTLHGRATRELQTMLSEFLTQLPKTTV